METGKPYEIKITPSQVLLRVAPPGEGAKANLNDIQKELKAKGIGYRHQQLFDIFRHATNQFEVLSTRETEEYQVAVTVGPEGLEATMVVTPPSRGGAKLDHNLIKEALKEAKIQAGILQDEIRRAIEQHIENRPIVVARGHEPKHGTDGWVDFILEQGPAKAPTEESTNSESINYKELNLIKNVAQGDLIARIHPPTAGEDGFTVLGKPLKARQGRPARIRLGKNINPNADGSELYAACPGFVVNENNRLSIEDIYQVDQVDATTGNIHFAGVVSVRRSVEDNFLIEAGKGIDIGGVVGKATLKCEGDITVHGGVMGGVIHAGRNVSAKFFSEATVQAGENVTAEDYILHCTVEAGKAVRVTKGGTGFINGGITRAGEIVVSPNLGSDAAEVSTHIEVGMRPNLRQQFEGLKLKMERNQAAFDKLRKNLHVLQQQREAQGAFPEEKWAAFLKSVEATGLLRDQLVQDADSFRKMAGEIAQTDSTGGIVFAENAINPGVTVQIRHQRLTIKSPLVNGAFKLMRGEVKVQDYAEALKIYKGQQARQHTSGEAGGTQQ